MKLSRILLYSSVAVIGATSVMSWQRSNATSAAQRRAAAVAWVQPAVGMPTAIPSAIAAAPTSPQLSTPAPATTDPTAAPSPGVAVPQTPSPRHAAAPAVVPADPNVQVIRDCNGQPANANLRSEPSLSPKVILGVIPQGQSVRLTGRTAIGDGEFWYEAIALTPLFPNSNLFATNTGAGQRGQRGWISKCFVEGEGR
jgi:hypothetical protein